MTKIRTGKIEHSHKRFILILFIRIYIQFLLANHN